MAHQTTIEFVKTYATPENAAKAAQKRYGNNNKLRFTVLPVETDKGLRYGVLFIGMEAVHAGVHFHFNVVG